MEIVSFEVSDKGKVRDKNEDYFIKYNMNDYKTEKYGKVFIVCDGIGGHLGGEVASKMASEKFIEIYYSEKIKITNIEDRIKFVLFLLNNEIFEYSNKNESLRGMGTTIVGLIFKDRSFYVFNIGDSKCFLIRKNKIIEMSEEHTLKNELVKNIFIEKNKLININKNILSRALGIEKSVKPYIKKFKLNLSDNFILCTDGLLNHVNEKEILKVIKNKKIKNKAEYLVNLANDRGGKDNITIIYIYFRKFNIKNLFKRN